MAYFLKEGNMYDPPFGQFEPARQTFYGRPVVVTPDTVRPRYQLPVDLWLPDDVRAATNAWALRVCGTIVENLIKDDEVLLINGAMHMNPRTYSKLRRGRERDMFQP